MELAVHKNPFPKVACVVADPWKKSPAWLGTVVAKSVRSPALAEPVPAALRPAVPPVEFTVALQKF